MFDETKAAQTVEIAPNGEARVDWTVKVLDEGEAVIRMKALTDEESDAMEQRFPCYIHGMSKMDSYCGEIRPDDQSGKFTLNVPKDRRPKESRLEVRWSPTLAGAMVDALPYMVDYPYGCTEQTLNRFLPTVITQKILLDMHLDLKNIEKKRTNLNAQEIGDDEERAKQWRRLKADRPHPSPLPEGEGTSSFLAKGEGTGNPVFDIDEVRRMVKNGVERLTEMQCSDGGWGWFSGWASARRRTPPRSSSTGCKSPSRTTSPWCPARSNAASSGLRTIRTSRSNCSRTRRSRTNPRGSIGNSGPTTSTPSSTWCWSMRA